MKIKNNLIKYSFLSLVFLISGCETFDLDQTKSPSQIGVEFFDPVYAFNYVQLQLPDFVNSANSFTQRVTRQMAMTGGNTYNNAFRNVNFDTNWSQGYQILNAIKLMEPKAIENQEFYALGAAKVIRIYVLLTLVDMYGDIPYTEAIQGNDNITPHFDKSADVYKGLLVEIDDAIAVLQQTNASTSDVQDLYYGSQDNWITLAKTLKYKIYHNARLAGSDIGISDIGAAINTLLSEGDYIDTPQEDFAFKYGTTRVNPNSRHPMYNDQYELGGGAYIGNYFMWAMTTEKGLTASPITTSAFADPRLPFYFYKQDQNPADENDFTLPRRTRPDHYNDDQYRSFYNNNATPYLVSNWLSGTIASNGYWGRDHGDNSGIPPDGEKRTCAGIYPIGGAYYSSSNYNVQNSGQDGMLGEGIMPMMLSSYVHFMIAEDALMLSSVSGFNALNELKTGIDQSIEKVINFIPEDYVYENGQLQVDSSVLQAQKTAYISFIENAYINSTAKLEIIIKEYYLAAWGNGIEPYNNYRRTGFPSNFQPTLEPTSGAFYNTALYPASVENNNPNAPTNVRTKKVFWDKANLNLH